MFGKLVRRNMCSVSFIRIASLLFVFFTLLLNRSHAQWSGADPAGNVSLNSGNAGIGVGTTAPQSKLHIIQNNNLVSLILEGNSTGWGSGMYFKNTAPSGKIYGIYASSYGSLNIGDVNASADRIFIGANGHIGINTSNVSDPGNVFFVEGGVRARKVTVDVATWPDYVFDSAYKQVPLKKVEQYIQKNHHLPDVPSADNVAKNGINIGDNQTVLLKKIEELTLYIIEQDKKIDALTLRMKEMENGGRQ